MSNLTIPAKAGITLTPAEADLLTAFRAAADDAQPTMVRMMQSIAAGTPRQRPALTLVDGQRQTRRTDGFASAGAMMVLAGIILLGTVVINTTDAPSPPPAPAPTPGAGIAYVPYVFADQDTGCQYLSTHTSTGLAPRVAADGKTHMGCKGGGS